MNKINCCQSRNIFLPVLSFIIFSFALLFSVNSQAAEFHVTKCDDLRYVNAHLQDTIILDNDIDCKGPAILWPIGLNALPNGFQGTFNGQNHTISNITLSMYKNPGELMPAGFFAATSGATISNLNLDNISVVGNRCVGALVGNAAGGTITNVIVTGKISGPKFGADANPQAVGGLVGCNSATISQSATYVIVEGGNTMGGLVGINDAGGNITQSFANGRIDANAAINWDDTDVLGGLVGNNNGGSVTDSYAMVRGFLLKAQAAIKYVWGGFGGNNSGSNTNTFATHGFKRGSFTQTDGINWDDTDVLSGGLVGTSNNMPVSSFWDIQLSGHNTSAGGVGKTTVEMKQQSTYQNWDFAQNWSACEGKDTPVLQSSGVGCASPVLQNTLLDPDQTSGTQTETSFGKKVAIDDNILVVSDTGDRGYNQGAVYIYRKNNDQWSLANTIFPTDGVNLEYFGHEFFLEGNLLYVFKTTQTRTVKDVYTFIYSKETGQWQQIKKQTLNLGTGSDNYLTAVTSNMLAIRSLSSSSRNIKIFENGPTGWQLISTITPVASMTASINADIDGDNVVVRTLDYSGLARIYIYTKTGQLKQVIQDPLLSNYFGNTVSLNGDTLVVSSGRGDCTSSPKPLPSVYKYAGTQWSFVQRLYERGTSLIEANSVIDDFKDGNIVITYPWAAGCLPPNTGAIARPTAGVNVYQNKNGQWKPAYSLDIPDQSTSGPVAAVSGNTLAVGSFNSGLSANKILVYSLGGENKGKIKGTVRDSQGNPSLGATVEISGPSGVVTLTTGLFGQYETAFLSAGTYQVTAKNSNHTFNPPTSSVTIPSNDTFVDFTEEMTQGTKIQTTVKNTSNQGVSGIVVKIQQGSNVLESGLTDASGIYTSANTYAPGSYDVVVSSAQYCFTPILNSQPITIPAQSSPTVSANFTAYNLLVGKLVDSAGQPIAAAKIYLRGTTSSFGTDANGYFYVPDNSTTRSLPYRFYKMMKPSGGWYSFGPDVFVYSKRQPNLTITGVR